MFERKYSEYIILISFLNGESETINYKDYHNDSYKEMLKLYTETKEKYKNHCVTIDFKGKTKLGEINIIFHKEIINEDKKIKEDAESYCTHDSNKVLENVMKSIKDLQRHRFYIKEQIDVYNKKENTELHKLEKTKEGKAIFTTEEKLSFFDNLQNIRDERRDCKNGSYMVERVFEDLYKKRIFLKDIESMLTNSLEIKEKQESKNVQLTDERVVKFKIMETVKFKTFKEKISLMAKLQKKYSRIIGNDQKMELVCYNKAK